MSYSPLFSEDFYSENTNALYKNNYDILVQKKNIFIYDSMPTIENSISKAVNYFKKKQDEGKMDPQAYILMDYLIRKFELDFKIDMEKLNRSFNEMSQHISLHFFYRIIEPKTPVKCEQLDAVNKNEWCLLKPLLCAEKKVENNFLEFLDEQICKGKYWLTHVVIGLKWLKEKQCFENEIKIDEMISKSIPLLDELAKNENCNTDLGIEAMAVLCYVGKTYLIEMCAIEEVLKVQRTDGGWGYKPTDGTSDDHTTVLALWLLSEIEYADKNPSVKWIVK